MTNALYLRQSLDRTEQAGHRPPARRPAHAVRRKGLGRPRRILRQQRVRQTPAKRPAYQALCDDIRAGVINRVAVWDLDRLHRPAHRAGIVHHLAEHHDRAGQRRRRRGPVHRERPDVREDEGRRGPLRNRAQERAATAREPTAPKVGKTWAQADVRVRRRPDRRARGRRDPRRYLALLNGASLGGIAEQWRRRVATTAGRRWTGATVRQMLNAERNAGLQVDEGEILDGVKTRRRPSSSVTCGMRRVPCWPTRSAAPAARHPGRKYLLSGLAICGECGRPVSSGLHTAARQGGRLCVHAARLPAGVAHIAPVDKYVVDRVTR